MKDYIERAAALNALDELEREGGHNLSVFPDIVEECRERIREVPAAAEWVSARGRLPEDQEEVLVCTRSKNGCRNIDKGYRSIDRWIHRGSAEVTHWMPLPMLPDEKRTEVYESKPEQAYEKLEQEYEKLQQMEILWNEIFNEIYDRAYGREDSPAEGTADYVAANNAMECIAGAIEGVNQAQSCISEAVFGLLRVPEDK